MGRMQTLFVIVALFAEVAACDSPGYFALSNEQLVANFLEETRHAAPALVDLQEEGHSECAAEAWEDARPDQPDRKWVATDLVAIGTVHRSSSFATAEGAQLLSPTNMIEEVFGTSETILLVQPWNGTALIQCSGTTVDSTEALIAIRHGQHPFLKETDPDANARFEMFEENVAEHELRPVDELALSEEDTCTGDDGPCSTGMDVIN